MSLSAALKEFIEGLGYPGAFFYGEIPPTVDQALCVKFLGSHNADPSRFHKFPRLSVYLRDSDAEDAKTWAQAIHAAFNVEGPLQLSPSFRTGHAAAAGLPTELGQDPSGRWRWALDLLLTTHYNATL